jgi:methionyl-tRNA formyltransferase
MPARRFAIVATDRYLGVMNAFLECGWEPVKLFTAPTDNFNFHNKAVIHRAQELKIDIQLSRLNEDALADLARRGCEVLVVASYQWRIPPWEGYLPYAINFHPSLLPSYRGPYPLVAGVLDQQRIWGVSCHRIAPGFDEGDILATRSFPIAERECHDSLDLKTQFEARLLAATVAQDFDRLWREAQPQLGGSYARLWNDADRTLDFHQPVELLERQLRAFGPFECLATVENVLFHVQRALVWPGQHDWRPGTVLHADRSRYLVACQGGFIALMKWSLVSREFRQPPVAD